jgi:hypothetical protein
VPVIICAAAAAAAAAGDGPGQHPTQALLDVYSIKKEIGRLDVSWQETCTTFAVVVGVYVVALAPNNSAARRIQHQGGTRSP